MEKVSKFVAIALAVIAMVILTLVIIGWGFNWMPNWLSEKANMLISILSCLMAVANALLLYATLASQNKGKFETTLFNLLDSHRKLVPTIKIEVDEVDSFLNKKAKTIKDNGLFEFAYKEIYWIKEVFHNGNYPFISDDDYRTQQDYIESLRDESSQESNEETDSAIKSLKRQYELSRRCVIYGITEKDWNKPYNGEEHLNEIAYKLFYTKWQHHYAPYFRSLLLMFNQIAKSDYSQDEKVRYRNYIIHQMSDHELRFLGHHCRYYPFNFNDYTFSEALNAISPNKRFIKENISSQEVH